MLIIDRDENSRTILSRRLQRRGFEVTVVEDGSTAVKEAQAFQPDVILMDLNVVTEDSWMTARQLKFEASTQHVPIIAMSVLDLTWDQEAALQAGCEVYLAKPIDMEMLTDVVERVTQSKCIPEQRT